MGSRPPNGPWTTGAVFASIGKAMDQSLIASVRAAERVLLPKGPQNCHYQPPTAVYRVPFGYSVQHTTTYHPYGPPLVAPPLGPAPYESPPPYPGPPYSRPPPPY